MSRNFGTSRGDRDGGGWDGITTYLPSNHDMRHFVICAHGENKITRFTLRFTHKKRTILATFQYQFFSFLARKIAMKPSAMSKKKMQINHKSVNNQFNYQFIYQLT